jgi:hypothetical protein
VSLSWHALVLARRPVIETAVLARCPTCRNTFSTDRTGRQDCPSCGKPLVVPEQAPAAPKALAPESAGPAPAAAPADGPASAAPPPPGFAEAPRPEPLGTPWERRGDGPGQIPPLKAWADTLMLALFEPAKLFSMIRIEDHWSHLKFALWTGAVFSIIGQLLGHALSGPLNEQMQRQLALLPKQPPPWMMSWIKWSSDNSLPLTLAVAALAPLFVFLFLYAQAGVTHLAALLLGQNKRGFAATFAAAAYAMAPAVLNAVPGCGAYIAPVWIAVLTGIGLKYTHDMTVGGAVGATLAPYLLLCCFTCAVTLAFVSLLAPGLAAAGG